MGSPWPTTQFSLTQSLLPAYIRWLIETVYPQLLVVFFRITFLDPRKYTLYHIFFIHSDVEEYLVCVHFLDIMNKVTMNLNEQVFCGGKGYMPKSNIAILLGSWGRLISIEAV